MAISQTLSAVIPTYGRDVELLDSIRHLLALAAPADELLVVDQTLAHGAAAEAALSGWDHAGRIRWIRHQPPGVVGAMNRGLREAKGDIVLFLDDDIIPDANLVAAHRQAYEKYPDAWAVAGQVVQGEDRRLQTADCRRKTECSGQLAVGVQPTDAHRQASGVRRRVSSPLRRDLDFDFSSTEAAWVENVMAGNLSVKREKALEVGGFDENFIPPVSYRFETEFAKRIVEAGGRIRFEPKSSILHLRVSSGGTRSQGSHLTSASPLHGVGDYYYALKHGKGWARVRYMARRPLREVCTKFHLRHPWWIPVKLAGEIRAMIMAVAIWKTQITGRSSMPSCRDQPLFLYSAWKQEGNLGDQVINRVLVEQLSQRGEFRVCGKGASLDFLRAIGVIPEMIDGTWAMALHALRARLCRRAVIVILSPGGSNDRLHLRWRRELREVAFWLLARIMGVRVVQLGFSLSRVVPERDRFERWFKPQRLKSFAGVRDSRSLSVLREWGVRDVECMPDLAFGMTCEPVPSRSCASNRYIVMSFRFDSFPPYMDRLLSATDTICEWALARGIRDLHLRWQVTGDAAGSRVLADRYRERMRVHLQTEAPNPQSLFGCYQSAAMVFSNRLHVLLFAWLHGGLPIAVGDETFQTKVAAFFYDSGLEPLLLNTEPALSPHAFGRQLDAAIENRDQWLIALSEKAQGYRLALPSIFDKVAIKVQEGTR